ncbi:Hypothetical predicted protein, partial [Pelobates cultripes]
LEKTVKRQFFEKLSDQHFIVVLQIKLISLTSISSQARGSKFRQLLLESDSYLIVWSKVLE